MTDPVDITIVSGATTITLPADIDWQDRRSRNLVAQSRETAANGAQIVEEFQQIGGYPITLISGPDVWVDKDTVDALIALADAPLAAPATLTFNDGTVISVRFRYEGQTPAVEAQPVWDAIPRDSTFPHTLTVRMIQASA